jgi:enoyl-CoA hydratase/long-chain 3-hydroxyacyl-CoA dehydrogenase
MLAASKSVSGLARIRTGIVARSLSADASNGRQFQYFDNVEVKNNVAIIRFNGPGKMNTISTGMQVEAEKIFKDFVLNQKDVKAVVFLSSKPDNFIAGADIDMIKAFEDKSKLKDLTLKAHDFFDTLKKTNIPMVAGINGVALGGGLEWAMYCDYRVATTSKKTSMGLPEVKLGLLPGMAGTYHLPKLVGYAGALDMILTGKNVKPDKAKKMGLVDLVVDPAVLEQVCIQQAIGLAEGKVKPTQRKKNLMTKLLEDTPLSAIMFKKAREQVDKSTGGHYPAPYAIIDVLKDNMGKSKRDHLVDEATKFAKLAGTPESEALIGIFHGMNAVKKHNFGSPTHPVNNIAVLGAGLMGAGIAQVSVDNGKYRVLLKDKDVAGVSRGEKVIVDELKTKLKKKRITNHQFCETTSRLIPLHDGVDSWKKHFSQADLVIEAVFEEIGVKHKVLKEMEEILPPHAIFASNTSAIPIGKIAEAAKR